MAYNNALYVTFLQNKNYVFEGKICPIFKHGLTFFKYLRIDFGGCWSSEGIKISSGTVRSPFHCSRCFICPLCVFWGWIVGEQLLFWRLQPLLCNYADMPVIVIFNSSPCRN